MRNAGWLVPSYPVRLLIVVLATTTAVPTQLHAQTDGPPPVTQQSETILALQVESCRQGLLDTNARPEDRQRWANLLFTIDSPAASALIHELLTSGPPAAQLALCQAIADQLRPLRMPVSPQWAEILLERLHSGDPALRVAAARALGVYDSVDLSRQLGDLAFSDESPTVTRVAAITALTTRMDRRANVRQLIRLLDLPPGELTDLIYAALEPTTRRSVARSPEAWKQWWADKERLSDEQWLIDRIEVYRDRYQMLQRDVENVREEQKRQMETIRSQMVDFQREVYRMLSPDERGPRLIQWLSSPLPDIRLTALSMVQARISDDGRPPEGPLRDAILPLLHDPSVSVRRQSLLIVQSLDDPAADDAVLRQLELETDIGTRTAILKALGRMAPPAAVPVLIKVATPADGEPTCVREAVSALGEISGGLEDAALRQSIITFLRDKYSQAPGDDAALRTILLGAMAATAADEFRSEFEDALNSTNAEVLRPAILGAKALKLVHVAPRLRTLTSDAEPLVRSAALDALGQLGTDDADVESLLSRLNPSIESVDDVREVAWRAFRDLVKRRPVPAQLALAQRLPENTDLPLRFLEQFTLGLEGEAEHESTLDAAYERLGNLLIAKERYVEAGACYKKLVDLRSRSANGNGKCAQACLSWLTATLRSDREADIGAAILLLQAEPRRLESDKMMQVIREHYESPLVAADPSRARKLLEQLKQSEPDESSPFWTDLVSLLERLSSDSAVKTKEARLPAG